MAGIRDQNRGVDRRRLLGSAALLAAAAGSTSALAAAPAAPTTPSPSAIERLTAKATEHRHRLNFDGTHFSGPAWDLLVREGKAAQFFLLGEEHGVAQIPALSRELLLALKPAGYERLALEISAPVAAEIDHAAQAGIDGIRRFIAEYPPGPAFYNMKEEAEFLAAVRPVFPAAQQLIWGLDYEVVQDRRLIARLQAKAPASAKPAVQALDDASAAAWKKFETTRNPQFFFSFSGDPALITAIRAVWPRPDPDSDVILDVLQGTLETNAFWVQRKGYESNARRTVLMRSAFARYWRAEKAKGRAPKTFFKFGASHMVRGRDMSETFDLGDLIADAATLEGGHSFHLFVGPPSTSMHAAFNPSKMGVDPVPAAYFEEEAGVGFLAKLAYPDTFTLIDLRPLRPIAASSIKTLDPRAVRVILGFDVLLVLSGSTPSVML